MWKMLSYTRPVARIAVSPDKSCRWLETTSCFFGLLPNLSNAESRTVKGRPSLRHLIDLLTMTRLYFRVHGSTIEDHCLVKVVSACFPLKIKASPWATYLSSTFATSEQGQLRCPPHPMHKRICVDAQNFRTDTWFRRLTRLGITLNSPD